MKQNNELMEHRDSFDSGIDVTGANDDYEKSLDNQDSPKGLNEEDEIKDFIKNKDLYAGKPVADNEDFNFDQFLYYYKSFHSPLIDKQFHGFSLEEIKKAAENVDLVKKDQFKKTKVNKALQSLKNKNALLAWRDEYRRMKISGRNVDFKNLDVDTLIDVDPDWTISNSNIPDGVFNPKQNKEIKFDQVLKAIEVFENQLDGEVEKVVASTSKPGRLNNEAINRRSAKLNRLGNKVESMKKKARSMSANPSLNHH